MHNIFTKKASLIGLVLLIIVFTSLLLFAYPSGYTGRTLKTSTLGCGSCHTYNTSVTGLIAGPDTVTTGQTITYSITISDPNRTHAGLDIAVRLGTLNPGPGAADIKLLNGELTHLHSISMSTHTITLQFNYIAPNAPGIDTIWATVTSGTPAWNWAPSKRVTVINALGIGNESTTHEYRLSQNYPNPFNPVTTISFELAKPSDVKLRIYDMIGNEVSTLIDSKLNEGKYDITWYADNFSSGVYFYTLETNGFTATKKMMLVK